MIQEEDFEDFVATTDRIKYLGFKPQKENLANHLLPYADRLDEESQVFLEQVKTNLAKAVMLREMKPACGVWSSRLMKYIRIYGLKFSKEDHIALVKLAYELVLIPDLEPCKVHKFATMFLMLTKEKYLITPEELVLPWRPLFDMGVKIFNKNATSIGMYHYHTGNKREKISGLMDIVRKFISGFDLNDVSQIFGIGVPNENELPISLEGSYLSMVKRAKPYFDVNATKDILEELLPYIFPWSSSSGTTSPLTALLPVGLHPKYAKQGHELWFDQLMTLWDIGINVPGGISELMTVFAGLAKRNPGAVDWSPYAPKMFSRFLHALNLPVGYKNFQFSKNQSLEMKQVASWIAWTINSDGVIIKHLRCFLAGIESYLHSANSGRWSFKLRDFLKKLAGEFLNRVRREREKKFKRSWENQTPDHYRLRDEDITEFVNVVLEPTFQAVYSRSGSLDISVALQNLATLRPSIVVPPLLEKLRTSLTSLTEPHRVTAAMVAVAAVARPMLRGAEADYPEGPTHVVPFLMAVLPGLDPNDMKKTLVTLHFILTFSCMMPLIDCSSAHEHWPDLTEEELLACESTAQFEDFVLIFLERVITFIESSVLEHARLDTKDSDWVRSKSDTVMENAISSAATAVLMQCSPKIFKEALRKFKAFATETTFETNVSGSMVGVLLHVFARIDSESTLAAFLPKLLEDLEELISSDEALREENPPRDLVYRLVLLMQVVDCDGTVLLKYIPKILPVLDRILKLHTRYALTRACEVLSHIFNALSNVEIKEWRSSPKDYGNAPEKWLPIRDWGKGCYLKDANLQWHVPTAEEAQCAQMISDRYLKHEVTRLTQWMSGERPMCRERRLRSFHIINAVLSCNTFLPQPNEVPIALLESQVPATDMPLTNGVPYSVTLDGENMRVALTRLLLEVQNRMLDDKSDDTRGLEMLIQVWERVVVMKGSRNGPGLEARLRSYNALERVLGGRGNVGGRDGTIALLRMLVTDAARLQDESRLDFVCDAGITPSALQALHALYDLSINTYSSVRMLAQARLHWMLNHYPYSYRALVPRLVSLLSTGGEGDEWHARHKGALFIMLGPKAGLLVSKQDWEVVRALWPAILKAPLSEKPSIHKLEQAISDTLHRNFPVVNTRLTISQSAIDAAKVLLDEKYINEQEFVEKLNKSVEKEIAASDKAEKVYFQLIDELVDIAESSNSQWRRLELAMQYLTYCPLIQTPYPPRAVKLFAQSLLHDDITVRRSALRLTHYALKQRKHKLKKIEVDPYEVAGVERPEKHIPGYRKDLEWAIWSEEREIKTDEEWDKPWLRDYSYGFYAWPKTITVAAPVSEQKYSIDSSPEEMEEGERYIFELFNDSTNIDKLVAFMTVEEKKGKDKFSGVRFSVFRMLFAQFGERVTDRLLEHALRCSRDTQEAPQRFAAEIATAALRAPRYWPRQRALDLQRSAMDIIKAGLTAVTPETLDDWGTCIATGVDKLDPTRGKLVLDQLMELCAPPPDAQADPDHHTSFVICARLYALQGALGSLTWRAAPLAAQLLKRLEAANYIEHPFQNVRETVGRCSWLRTFCSETEASSDLFRMLQWQNEYLLMTIFYAEVVFPGGQSGGAPRLEEFLASVKPKLAALYDENNDIVITSAAYLGSGCSSARACVSQPPPQRVPVAALAPAPQPARARLSPDPPRPARLDEETDPVSALVEREGRVDKQLVVRLDSALRLSGDAAASPPASPAQQQHAAAVNLLTTVLRGCIGIIVRGVNANIEAQYELVATACALASRGPPQPHEELPRAAGGFLATLALAKHSYIAFDKALDVLDGLADERSWWARLASLDFAQPLLFYGLPLLCDQAERAVRAEKFALKLMRDSRVEVRQLAAKLLTGLMHCRALQSEEKTLKSLMKSCRSKELVERHCGVLGLCAYLSSRPYSLGPRLGEVLTELARHTNAPDPIPNTIRAALADFRRTHQDDWPKHREQLTEEELDLLADLTSPPSYCA